MGKKKIRIIGVIFMYIFEKLLIVVLSAFAGIGWFCMMEKSGAFQADIPVVQVEQLKK
jgi:hypothetical protein